MDKSKKDESSNDNIVDSDGVPQIDDDEPKKKLLKLSRNVDRSSKTTKDDLLILSLRDQFTATNFINKLKQDWASSVDFKDSSTGAEFFAEPFRLCVMPDFLSNKSIVNLLVQEMVYKVDWSRKQMDLYEFYQSTDISNLSASCRYLSKFRQMLRKKVMPWLEQVTNTKLDYVSASCSMYTCGDYLLVHDDLLKNRQIAFIYYVSPWEGVEQWTDEQGGCLEIFDSDASCFPHFPVRRKIHPKNNQFAFFKVGSKSFHQVGEVTTFDYPRLTINGWFHGNLNNDVVHDSMRPFTKEVFQTPAVQADAMLKKMINEVYLKPTIKANIQERIEDNSEICLYEFLTAEVFRNVLDELKFNSTLVWTQKGPANGQSYEMLDLSSATETVADLVKVFTSVEMFVLLQEYTDLDFAGPNANKPSFTLELQRWSHGNYTVLGDSAICEENTLDLLFYLNASDGAGIVTYLSPEAEEKHMKHEDDENVNENDDDSGDNTDNDDESVLLTITPVDNALNIVYRCEGTTKFTKYVSRNTPLVNGPVYILCCSYKE